MSLSGRQILIYSVLDALPTYMMSLFPIPSKVVKKLDKLRRDFLWHGNKKGKGYCLVSRKIVMLTKGRGVLEVRNLRLLNENLLMKWLWRYTKEERDLWRKVIVTKFGELNPWCSNIISDPFGEQSETYGHWWKPILALRYTNKTKFWHDEWIDQSPQEQLPDPFQICGNRG